MIGSIRFGAPIVVAKLSSSAHHETSHITTEKHAKVTTVSLTSKMASNSVLRVAFAVARIYDARARRRFFFSLIF